MTSAWQRGEMGGGGGGGGVLPYAEICWEEGEGSDQMLTIKFEKGFYSEWQNFADQGGGGGWGQKSAKKTAYVILV